MTRKLIYYSLSFLILLLAGCRADEPIDTILPGSDGKTTLNLLIPSPSLARETRAYSDQHGSRLAEEGKINNLFVVGFYTKRGEDTPTKVFEDLTDKMSTNVEDVYLSYTIRAVAGDYKLFVVANAPESLTADLKASETENDVNEIIHSISSGDSIILPDAANGLPMASGPVKTSITEGKTTNVVASMKFLCAKVRVTVIYNKAFGETTKFKVSGMNALNVYTDNTIFPTVENPRTGTNFIAEVENVGDHAHYGLGACEGKTLQDLVKVYTDLNEDPLENLGDKLEEPAEGYAQFAWQNVSYLPPCIDKGENGTALKVFCVNDKAYDIPVGCDDQSNDHLADPQTGGNIRPGHFYDIVAMVKEDGDVSFAWDIEEWNAETLAIQLAGKTELYLNETKISATLNGEEPYYISYRTSAPRLYFESEKTSVNGTEIPIFKLTEDKVNHRITVNINSEIPAGTKLKSTGFWVEAGNIRKKVDVADINLSKYLRLLPETQTVYTTQISNEALYEMYYDYATNADNLKIELISVANPNIKNGNNSYDEENAAGIYIEICSSETDDEGNYLYTPLSEKVPLKAVTDLGSNLLPGKTLPTSGVIRITLMEPTNTDYFSKKIKGKLKASATDVTSKEAEFTIEPNPAVYTIHFKAKEGDNENKWGSPHIYIYQPLYFNGIPVYGKDGNYINWIEYSFTGNRAFKGWKKDGNVNGVDDLTGAPTTIEDAAKNSIIAYDLGSSWGSPAKEDQFSINQNNSTDSKNWTIANNRYAYVNLLGDFRGDCTSCFPTDKDPTPPGLWPGCGMKKESNGWWKIELPLLAKPGEAFIMFTSEHSGGDRYPGVAIPGIPFPEYHCRTTLTARHGIYLTKPAMTIGMTPVKHQHSPMTALTKASVKER